MDIDPPDDSDFEPSEDNISQASDDERRFKFESGFIDGNDNSSSAHLTKSRWERLQPFYNDRYLELFRETFNTTGESSDAFEPSQCGAVSWSASEKAKLFEGLSKTGRHNLPRLAESIGTKSSLEVKAYLEQLRSAEIDRQMFEKQTKNISQAEIPAAIEIGPDLEARLEKAADALAAFQDQYDLALAQQTSSSPVVITYDMAFKIDEKTERGLDDNESGQTSSTSIPVSQEFFKLCTFLELSEKLFMHDSLGSPKTHWSVIAEQEQRPGITLPVFVEFYDLVVSLLQRLIQTTIFIADSRLRATTTKHKTPKNTVKNEDVECALKILNVKLGLWDYWISLPRRSKFKVVAGSKRKGDSVKHSLSYDEVEAALSVRQFSGRRRSLSVASQRSGSSEAATEEVGADSHEVEGSSADNESGNDDSSGYTSDHSEQPTEDVDGSNADATRGHNSRRHPLNKRKRILEQELDEYLEILDGNTRNAEEARISSLLGFDDMTTIKDKDIELGRRPKVLRRSVEEVHVWNPTYLAEWEAYPKPLPLTTDQEAVTSTEEAGNV